LQLNRSEFTVMLTVITLPDLKCFAFNWRSGLELRHGIFVISKRVTRIRLSCFLSTSYSDFKSHCRPSPTPCETADMYITKNPGSLLTPMEQIANAKIDHQIRADPTKNRAQNARVSYNHNHNALFPSPKQTPSNPTHPYASTISPCALSSFSSSITSTNCRCPLSNARSNGVSPSTFL